MKKMLSLAIALLVSSNAIAYDSWYRDQKRGWFWFEEPAKDAEKQQARLQQQSPAKSLQIIERFKQRLEDAKNVMMAFPTAENVAKYMRLEEVMWQRAQELEQAQKMAQFMYPELNEVSNVPAIRIKREIEADSLKQLINSFAREFDLVLVKSSACPACTAFEPIVKDLCDQYSFNCEALGSPGTVSKYFKTVQNINLFRGLKIAALPTLLMVHKAKPITIELAVGYLTADALERRFVLADRYLKMKSDEKNSNSSY